MYTTADANLVYTQALTSDLVVLRSPFVLAKKDCNFTFKRANEFKCKNRPSVNLM